MGTPAGFPDFGGGAIVSAFKNDIDTTGTVAPNTTTNISVSTSRPGYLILLTIWNSSDSVNLAECKISVSWKSSITGREIRRQTYNVLGGTAGQPHIIHGRGPVESGSMVISLQNPGVSFPTLGFIISMDETSEAPPEHEWHTDDEAPVTYPGWAGSISGSEVVAGVVGAGFMVAQAGNTDTDYLLPLYSGRATLWAFASSNIGSMQFGVRHIFSKFIPGNIWVATVNPPAAGQIVNFRMPRSQCSIDIANQTAGSANAYWAITARRM